MSILIPKGANDAINSREEFFKEKEDHIKKQKREKFISDKLVAAGMRYNYTKKRFESKDKTVILTFEDFEGASEEQITKLAEAYKKYIQETSEI